MQRVAPIAARRTDAAQPHADRIRHRPHPRRAARTGASCRRPVRGRERDQARDLRCHRDPCADPDRSVAGHRQRHRNARGRRWRGHRHHRHPPVARQRAVDQAQRRHRGRRDHRRGHRRAARSFDQRSAAARARRRDHPLRRRIDAAAFLGRGLGRPRSAASPCPRGEFNGRDAFAVSSGREIGYNDVPAELAGSVEVFKNLTADMIEGGISGTVSINTRKPFDSKKTLLYPVGRRQLWRLRAPVGPPGRRPVQQAVGHQRRQPLRRFSSAAAISSSTAAPIRSSPRASCHASMRRTTASTAMRSTATIRARSSTASPAMATTRTKAA